MKVEFFVCNLVNPHFPKTFTRMHFRIYKPQFAGVLWLEIISSTPNLLFWFRWIQNRYRLANSVVFLKKSWNECQGKYIQIVFGTAGERGRGNQLSISWFRNCSIRLNSGSLRTLTFESLQFILISKKSLPGYFWNRNVKGESTWKWCVLIEHMILQFLKHPFHIEYL